MDSASTNYAYLSLGQVPIVDGTFEHDLKINDGYQAYGSELLRLALLAIAGLAAVWLKLYVPDKAADLVHPTHTFGLRLCLLLSFAGLLVSAAASLIYKYAAADSLAYHLTALRRRVRNKPAGSYKSDLERAKEQEEVRGVLFKRCEKLLITAIVSLLAGVLVFGFGMFLLMI